jgi:hypothetical protein
LSSVGSEMWAVFWRCPRTQYLQIETAYAPAFDPL